MQATLESFYRLLFLIRRLEERVAAIYPSDKIKSPIHLSIGQEGPSVAVCAALRPSDVVFGTYRGHALYLAKGGDLSAMVAELFGKRTGCTRGKGGSMHLADAKVGMMGASAVVATSIPQAVGYAFAEKTRGRDTVVATFFGDGAMEEGVFAESLNFAALWKLPVLFVAENNFYAIHAPLSQRVANADFCRRAECYGVPASKVEHNDLAATHQKAVEAVEAMRRGEGPRFLEIETYRYCEHVGPGEDWHLGYRPSSEADPWKERDPLVILAKALDPSLRERIEQEALAEIEAAFAFAEASPFPGPEELHDHVFSL